MKSWRRLALLALPVLGACVSGCSSATAVTAGDGGADALAEAGIPDGRVAVPTTSMCTGDETRCLSGTLAVQDFTLEPSATKVTLYHLFPHGNVEAVAWVPVALDGTFAFSGVDAWDHYYLQGEARFDKGTTAYAIVANVGPYSVPAKARAIPIVLRPVLLEVLQQAPSGGATTLSWASAHLFDPASGAEVTQGTVALVANNTRYPMPFATNAGGTKSFYVSLPPGTPGGTSFTITTAYGELAKSPVKWQLAGEPATFGGAITGPAGPVPVHQPITVTWKAQPLAAYMQTELFLQQGSSYALRYSSPTVLSPIVTTETIPASDVTTAGAYLVNENYATATCPASSAGCVYNVATATANLTVK